MRHALRRSRPVAFGLLLAACGDNAGAGADARDAATLADAATAVPVDAALDAPATGRLLVSWTFYREGVADPSVTCADLDAETTMLTGGVGLIAPLVPCDQHFLLVENVPPQTLEPTLMIMRPDGAGGGFASRVALRPDAPVTVVAGATTYVPLELRLFDEPYRQLQQLFDGAAAFYAASAEPKAFPTGEPGDAGCGWACTSLSGICSPDPARWTVPPFSQLGFTVPGLSRFTYDFESHGSGASAEFTITASADYDCDAALRVYSIHGSVASDGTVVGAATVMVDDHD